jgi:flagellar motility protein MotE (MotC chaperone)
VSVQYVVDEQGKRVGVMLPIEEYERMLEELEESEDIRAADEARREIENGEDELVPWEEAKKRIGEERAQAKRGGLV